MDIWDISVKKPHNYSRRKAKGVSVTQKKYKITHKIQPAKWIDCPLILPCPQKNILIFSNRRETSTPSEHRSLTVDLGLVGVYFQHLSFVQSSVFKELWKEKKPAGVCIIAQRIPTGRVLKLPFLENGVTYVA